MRGHILPLEIVKARFQGRNGTDSVTLHSGSPSSLISCPVITSCFSDTSLHFLPWEENYRCDVLPSRRPFPKAVHQITQAFPCLPLSGGEPHPPLLSVSVDEPKPVFIPWHLCRGPGSAHTLTLLFSFRESHVTLSVRPSLRLRRLRERCWWSVRSMGIPH